MWEKWYQNNIHNNYHADSCTTGNVKLVGGNTTSEGVEYCYKDRYKIPQSHCCTGNNEDQFHFSLQIPVHFSRQTVEAVASGLLKKCVHTEIIWRVSHDCA